MEELKRRVQDEVTAQWEEQRRQQHTAQHSETTDGPAAPTAPRSERAGSGAELWCLSSWGRVF